MGIPYHSALSAAKYGIKATRAARRDSRSALHVFRQLWVILNDFCHLSPESVSCQSLTSPLGSKRFKICRASG